MKVAKLFLFIAVFGSLLCSESLSDDGTRRKPFTQTLLVDKDQFYSSNVDSSYYITPDNHLQIFAGEKLFIEAKAEGSKVILLRKVDKITDSSSTIIFSFTQSAENKKHQMMMLTVQNPFNKVLKYKAKMLMMGFDKWYGTSIMPVEPKISGIEIWNEIITSLNLFDFTVADKDKK